MAWSNNKIIGIGILGVIVGLFVVLPAIQIANMTEVDWIRIEGQRLQDNYIAEHKEELKETTRNYEEPAGCMDINWKYHTQDIYNTMSEDQYCPEFKFQLGLACSQEATQWWKDMLVLWGC